MHFVGFLLLMGVFFSWRETAWRVLYKYGVEGILVWMILHILATAFIILKLL